MVRCYSLRQYRRRRKSLITRRKLRTERGKNNVRIYKYIMLYRVARGPFWRAGIREKKRNDLSSRTRDRGKNGAVLRSYLTRRRVNDDRRSVNLYVNENISTDWFTQKRQTARNLKFRCFRCTTSSTFTKYQTFYVKIILTFKAMPLIRYKNKLNNEKRICCFWISIQ